MDEDPRRELTGGDLGLEVLRDLPKVARARGETSLERSVVGFAGNPRVADIDPYETALARGSYSVAGEGDREAVVPPEKDRAVGAADRGREGDDRRTSWDGARVRDELP